MPDTDKLPTSWRPRAGETLSGFVSQRTARPSQYSDEEITVVVVEPGIGPPVSIWCSATSLREFLKTIDPQEGDFISLHYEGATVSRKGYEVKKYLYSKTASSESE